MTTRKTAVSLIPNGNRFSIQPKAVMERTRRKFFTDAAKAAAGLSIAASGLPVITYAAEGGGKKGKTVQTMKGPVAVKDLGLTLIHEHLLYREIPKEKEEESVAFTVKLLKDAERVGINTIVDLSPTRDIKLYQQMAAQTSINVIVSTGSYLEHRMPDSILKLTAEQYKDRLREEITKGIGGTNIKAGIMKIATRAKPMSTWERMVFKASAEVQKELGTPIGTHATHNPGDQFDWLVQNGADPAKIFLSHTEAKFGWGGKTREQMGEELLRIAKSGGSMLFNNFGYEFDTPWEDLVYLIRLLCEKGYLQKALTSVDCNWHWEAGKMIVNVDNVHPETRNRTYAYMITDAVPALLKAGFSAKDVHAFLYENPVAFFS